MTRILGRRLAGPLAAVLCCAVALAVGSPGAGSAATGRAGGAAAPAGLAGSAGSAGLVSQPVAGPGTNLLLNPGAQAGAASAEGWDAVTIPGWQVSSGLPTVVPYGAPHLSPATGQGPAVHGGSLFAGGAGGTARLTQAVSLRQAAGPPVATGTRYQLSGWLGGTATSQAAVTVAFLSATGAVLARRVISHGRGNDRLAYRAAAGTLPAGTASARVTLVLATSLTNDDGPNAPLVGYDRAVADGLRFSVSAPVRRPAPLTPPAAHVPRYQHVFLFYFENEDLGAVTGQQQAGAVPQQPGPALQRPGQLLRRGAPERRQLPRAGRRQRVRRPAHRPAGAEPPVHDPRPQHRRPHQRPARDVEDLPAERERPVRRHGAQVLLERRRADDLLRRRPRPARLLRGAPAPAPGAADRPGQRGDHAELRLAGPRRLRRHGGLRDQGRRRVPADRAGRHHALAGVADPAVPGHHHLRRGRLRLRAPGPARADAHARVRRPAGLRVARPLHPLQPAPHDRGRARPGHPDPQRPLRAAGERCVQPRVGRPGAGRQRGGGSGSWRRPGAAGRGHAHGGGDAGGASAGADRAAASDGLRGELRRHGHAHRPDDPPGGQADQGRREPAGDRHHAGRQDRLRRQLRLELGHADQDRQPAGGHADPGREAAVGDRHHAGRPDRLRRQLRLGHGHARSTPAPGGRARRSRSGSSRGRSPSRPTARPPTCSTGGAPR